jgi:carboxyl-terminal processing protease
MIRSLNIKTMVNFLRKIKKKIILPLSVGLSILMMATVVSNDFEISKSLDIYATLFRQLSVHYADELEAGKLNKVAIDAMLQSLDPYTIYIPESEIEDFRFMTTGQLGGIGAWVHQRKENLEISGMYANSPAAEKGLETGDILIEIDGKNLEGLKAGEVNKLLQGQAGTSVEVTVRKPLKDEIITAKMKRKDIQMESIPYFGVLKNNTGYIKLNSFTQNAGSEVKEAFLKLKNEHNITSLILDLRDNGGGLLIEAVNIANIFVKKNQQIVSTRGRVYERNRTYKTSMPPVDMDIPLAVLINERSASASEIVAGALQDMDRAVIIGQRSFGKGLVQNVVPLSYNSQLKVTVAKYYIPSGRCIQAIDYFAKNKNAVEVPDSLISAYKTANNRVVYDGKGINPDIKVELGDDNTIISFLKKEYIIFDFATQYHALNGGVENPETFELSENAWKDFIAFVEKRKFSYTTESEKVLKKLEKAMEKEEHLDLFQNDIASLKTRINNVKKDDILRNEKLIKRLLQEEIVYRSHFQNGKIRNSLTKDEDIIKSIEVLTDRLQLTKLLAGGYKK